MNFFVDIHTFLLTFVLGNLFTVLLITAYRTKHPKEVTSGLYIAAKCLQIVFWSLPLLPYDLYHTTLAQTGMIVYLLGGALEAVSLLFLLGMYNNRVKIGYIVLAGCSLSGVLLLNAAGSPEGTLIAFVSFMGVLYMLYPAYSLWRNRTVSPLQKLMGLMYAFVIIVFLLLSVVLLYSQKNLHLFFYERIQLLYFAAMYLLMVLGSAGFMLLFREQSYIELERVATYDELTGILNRRAFILRARSLLAKAAVERVPISYLLLDIDHFKNVNDTFGHDTGDKVLRDFTVKIELGLGQGDLFGRFGGEEFAILLYGADEKTADGIAAQLCTSIRETVINNVALPYTVSIGVITTVPGQRVSLHALYKSADRALYRAKRKGRNCVVRSRENHI